MNRTLVGAFYIVSTHDGEWFRLHLTKTHYCLGGSHDYSALLRTISRYVKKYKNEVNLMSRIRTMDDGGRVSDSTYGMNVEDYNLTAHLYQQDVDKTVTEALKDVKYVPPLLRSMSRRKRLVPVT